MIIFSNHFIDDLEFLLINHYEERYDNKFYASKILNTKTKCY